MKKSLLLLLTLVPLAAGYCINLVFPVPVVGSIAFYLLPFVMLGFLFWLGRQYAGTGWGPCRALLSGNAVGLLSLVLYLWQFEVVGSDARDSLLASVAQMYPSAAPQFLLGPIARLFPHAVTVLMLLSVAVLAAVFAWGYFSGRKAR